MPFIEGQIDVVQEGRVRLVTEDGRTALFQLSPSASLEPQDLPALSIRRCRARISYAEFDTRGAALAHELTVAGGGFEGALPRYMRASR
jgi:hypothetical protein